MRRPRIRSRRPAIFDFEVRNLCAHATADVLSQKVTTCSCLSGIWVASRASQPSNLPHSSKSFIVRSPEGLSDVINRIWRSSGHSSFHKNGVSGLIPLTHVPPAPSLQASVYPM